MSKSLLIGLVILGLAVVVLLFQRDSVEVNLIFQSYNFNKAFTLFSFTTVGIGVGLLLK